MMFNLTTGVLPVGIEFACDIVGMMFNWLGFVVDIVTGILCVYMTPGEAF